MTDRDHMPVGAGIGQTTLGRRRLLAGAAALGAAALVGCSPRPTGTRQQTLFIAGWQWGLPTTFNPFSPTAAFPTALDQMQLLYEALFGFDVRDGSLRPHLARALSRPDDKTIEVALQPAARWQDGQAVTADDVVFTLDLAKRHAEAPYASFWQNVSTVKATDDRTVTIALDPERLNPGFTMAHLSQVGILPKHLWTGIESQHKKITDFPNMKPVGSGPYKLEQADATQVKLVRDDAYWGKAVRGSLPAPKWIVHPIFKDNAAGDLAFERGEVDVSQQFTPEIWKMWQDRGLPVITWLSSRPYFLPGAIPMLVLNTTKQGLDDPRIRRALAFAIDYPRIATTAMSQYCDPVQSSVIVPAGAERQYFDQANITKNGWRHDPAMAAKLLSEAGAAKDGDGVYRLAGGTRLGPWTLQTPSGWSDWQAAAQIVVENLRALGVDVRTQFPQAPQVTTAVQNGDFDLAIWFVAGTSPATPWQRFRDVLDHRGVPPAGQSAFYNYGRFSHPAVATLLDRAAATTGEQAKQAYRQLDTIFMQNAPMVSLMYRPLDFFEAHESVWQGFPTAAKSTAPPMFRGDGVAWLYQIAPKSS
jgi:peptide/nickel transport system substrate-binding protein